MNNMIHLGHQCILLNGTKDIINDCYRHNPDLFFGSSTELDRPTTKALAKNPQIKVLLTKTTGIPNEHLVRLVSVNRQDTKFADFHDSDFLLKFAADTLNNEKIQTSTTMQSSDVFYVGENKPEKQNLFIEYLYRLIYPNSNLKVKIAGIGQHPSVGYVGPIENDAVINSLYHSSRASLNLTLEKPYLNHRIYQIMQVGGLCVSNSTEYLKQHCINNPDTMILVNNVNELINSISITKERREYIIKKSNEFIHSGNTFIDRCQAFEKWVQENYD